MGEQRLASRYRFATIPSAAIEKCKIPQSELMAHGAENAARSGTRGQFENSAKCGSRFSRPEIFVFAVSRDGSVGHFLTAIDMPGAGVVATRHRPQPVGRRLVVVVACKSVTRSAVRLAHKSTHRLKNFDSLLG